jgi:hypothetical protein
LIYLKFEANYDKICWGDRVKIIKRLQKDIIRGLNVLSGKAALVFHGPKKPSSPLADRLLADALRLAEIPSPTSKEEQRAAFVLERLRSLGLVPQVDDEGNVLVRIHAASVVDEPPLLLFTDLGTKRWHPLESLARLDPGHAYGAGLGDVLGAAALLSVAEGVTTGLCKSSRDLLLLFAARTFDDPETDVFRSFTGPMHRPFAAIGVRAFMLGSVVIHTQGIYRIDISFSLDREEQAGGEDRKKAPKRPASPDASGLVVSALLSTARKLSGIHWDANDTTKAYIHRVEAAARFGKTPSEGILELELESSDPTLLDMAMNAVKATAEGTGDRRDLKVTVNVSSFIPVGDPEVSAELARIVQGIMKEQRIKMAVEGGADPSAFLSNQGIPALSLGLVQGQEGLVKDTIEIASIEKGRILLERIIDRITREPMTGKAAADTAQDPKGSP